MFKDVYEAITIVEVCDATEVAKAVVGLVERSCEDMLFKESHDEIIDFIWGAKQGRYENEILQAANESTARPAIVYMATVIIVSRIAKLSNCDRMIVDKEAKAIKQYFMREL